MFHVALPQFAKHYEDFLTTPFQSASENTLFNHCLSISKRKRTPYPKRSCAKWSGRAKGGNWDQAFIFLLLYLIELLNPLTEPKAVLMAEWNAFYQNEDEEEGQEEGEQYGGKMKCAALVQNCRLPLITFIWSLFLTATFFLCIFLFHLYIATLN